MSKKFVKKFAVKFVKNSSKTSPYVEKAQGTKNNSDKSLDAKKRHKSWFLKASLVRKRTASLKSLLQSNTSAFGGPLQRGAFCQFPFRWIYYCGSNKSTGKKSGKMHLCALFLALKRNHLKSKTWAHVLHSSRFVNVYKTLMESMSL